MTIVIMLGLVLMWAVVLVPMWLRRHDDVEESRSLDRFSTAMHTLSRREPDGDKKYLVMPHRSRAHEVHVSGAALESRPRKSATEIREERLAVASERAGRRAERPAGRPAGRPGAAAVAASRRRTLAGLVSAVFLTLIGLFVVGGTVVLGLQVLSDVCLAIFAFGARDSGQGASASDVRRRSAPARTARPSPARSPRRREAGFADYRDDYRDGFRDDYRDEYRYDEGMYDDVEWHVPAPTRRRSAPAAPRRSPAYAELGRPQSADLFDQDAIQGFAEPALDPRDQVFDAWLDDQPTATESTRYAESPRYADAPRYVEEPWNAETPRVQTRAMPAPERPTAPTYETPSRPEAPTRRQAARADQAAEQHAPRSRTVDSRRSSVSDRIASYARDLEVESSRSHRAPRPESETNVGGQPWEPVPVPRPVYTTKPAAPRRSARAPIEEPLPPAAEPTRETQTAEDLEEILDRRWAVND